MTGLGSERTLSSGVCMTAPFDNCKNCGQPIQPRPNFGRGSGGLKKIFCCYNCRCAFNNRQYHRHLKDQVIDAYGGKCKCCGDDHREFLSIDHINGGGNQHRKRLKGNHFYELLKKENYPKEEYQLLCMNCNFSIGKYSYCPHQRKVGDALENRN